VYFIVSVNKLTCLSALRKYTRNQHVQTAGMKALFSFNLASVMLQDLPSFGFQYSRSQYPIC
jgi:hypothetical protein